jgi:hypothetical protein
VQTRPFRSERVEHRLRPIASTSRESIHASLAPQAPRARRRRLASRLDDFVSETRASSTARASSPERARHPARDRRSRPDARDTARVNFILPTPPLERPFRRSRAHARPRMSSNSRNVASRLGVESDVIHFKRLMISVSARRDDAR